MAEGELSLELRAMAGARMTFEERRAMWLGISPGITGRDFDSYQAWRRRRLARTPRPGGMAPDFELEGLAPDGARTGETVRLSALRGTPVALVFGSYT